jgi:hypothetical protein
MVLNSPNTNPLFVIHSEDLTFRCAYNIVCTRRYSEYLGKKLLQYM